MSQPNQYNQPIQQIQPNGLNIKQVSKLNQLDQISIKPPLQQIYNLEYIFNKIKEIGRIIQLIRIERRGIIYGVELWEILSNILGKEEINADLSAEAKNYEFNTQVMDIVDKRISAIKDPNPEAYPDYYMNNIIKLYYQNNTSELNMVSLMHLGLDIGQLEYLMYKYMNKMVMPCYTAKKYDDELFIKILVMIQNIGRTVKNFFVNEIPEEKKLLPELLVKYIQKLFEEYGNELVNQMSKYKLNRDKIKIFFEVTMDEDLHNADDFNIQEQDTIGERAYKVIYKYLRDDFNNNINEYLLNCSYKILYIMLDLYNYDKEYLPIDKMIEFMFYSGEFLASIVSEKNLQTTTFLENMKIFDDISINKLLNIKLYFENNNFIPNKEIVDLLDKFINKLKTKQYSISTEKIVVIPEHISYLPVEITQLFCIIKPKQTTNVEILILKLNEIINQLSNPVTIDGLFNNLKETVKLDEVPIITSILTSENDLYILGINENAFGDEEQFGEIPVENVEESEPMAGGRYYNKYIKYKTKYLKIKNKIKI